MSKLHELKKNLRRGKVYRRADLAKWSRSVDRHLEELVNEGTLQKLSQGLYFYPKMTAFGQAPPEEQVLVRSFLMDSRFLLTSFNAYNVLGVGTTQLYNQRIVYNHKRHGDFNLGGKLFSFRVKPYFPSKVTLEFLMVDLLNNLEQLAEDPDNLISNVRFRAKTMNQKKLRKLLQDYGTIKTKRILEPILTS
jgi:hypothetical protein